MSPLNSFPQTLGNLGKEEAGEQAEPAVMGEDLCNQFVSSDLGTC